MLTQQLVTAMLPPHAIPAMTDTETIALDTRFGRLSFDRALSIRFLRGLLGFPQLHDYGLARVPGDRPSRFVLLQSLEDPSSTFPCLPIDPASGPIAADDIAEACGLLGFNPANAAVLVVVARRSETGPGLTANLRAPVIIDTQRRLGWQFVLSNTSYEIRAAI